MADPTIEELLARISLRDRSAFSDLYDRTSAKLFAVALRILNEQTETEDAVHDAYIKVWRKAGTFQLSKATGMTWLITITRNAAIDRARKRKTPAADIQEQTDLVSDAPSPEDEAARSDQYRRLAACLDKLEDPQKSVIRDAFFKGRTYNDLAGSLGKPAGTVKSWVRRGLAKLRGCLETEKTESVSE
ncbi:sigma-70 family RNA polymerase sigma factor [Hyphococcus flavus]|uniref:Sigma-70 family RNA polymerase sigma factor n=1 Tax=Hyphococcus flavus TaxID=1866326 RepID=A0AAF0CHJ6_9PROT|nr:sigma-70 family RNA polymerase sigma factor [Hyphococcus flavus]WDI31992.1 sigma-70 family RNA polymerase sigma factor [Hyphococcus flavus]